MSQDDEMDDEFVIEGDPRTEVYISTQGNICINQISDSDDTDDTVYFSADDAEKVVEFMRECIAMRRQGFIPEDNGEDEDEAEGDDEDEECDECVDEELDDEDFEEDEEGDEDEDDEDDEDDGDDDEPNGR
jgi:hypothetical protein